VKSDIYEELKQSTPKERLRAAIWFWEQAADSHADYIAGLETGFALAQPDGWRHVAPAWLREIRKEKAGATKR